MKRKECEGFSFKADLLKISPGTKKVINGVEISREVSFPDEFRFRIVLEDKINVNNNRGEDYDRT